MSQRRTKATRKSSSTRGRATRDNEALKRARLEGLVAQIVKGFGIASQEKGVEQGGERGNVSMKIDYGYEFNWTDLGRPPIVRREFSEETVEYLGHPDLVELAQRERDFQPIGEELRRRLMRLPAQELEKAGKIGLEHIKRPGKERM